MGDVPNSRCDLVGAASSLAVLTVLYSDIFDLRVHIRLPERDLYDNQNSSSNAFLCGIHSALCCSEIGENT